VIEKGLIYVLIGDKYAFTGFPHWEMCKKSVGSVKLHCPDLHVTLITESEVRDDDPGFDNVIVLEVDDKKYMHPWTYKLMASLGSPYEKTILLDVDTRVHSNRLLEIYSILGRFDIAAALSHVVIGFDRDNGSIEDLDYIPASCSEHNVGVLGFVKNDKTNDCWKYMIEMMNTHQSYDERWLRKYRYGHPELLVETLPPQFNLRSSAILTSSNFLQNTVVEHHHGIWK